jgi:Co/Zn/Cd efflux system component
MLSLIRTGHTSSCPALSHERCTCERTQYIVTGILALTVGLTQAFFGYNHSVALLSDSLHALADALADFVGVFIVWRIYLHPLREDEYRKRGDKIIATLLALGALWVLYETAIRALGAHQVTPHIAMLVGYASAVVDYLRYSYLRNAQVLWFTRTRESLMQHAHADYLHGLVVGSVGMMAWLVELLFSNNPLAFASIRALDIGLSLLLVLYMLRLSHRMWEGHSCGHDHIH